MEQLRGLAVRPRVDFDCCSTVKRYYSQLHSLQNRFPLSSENELLEFSWKDIYSGAVWRTSNIKYEMASILYNIAALHSKLGIEESRTDPESMKIACTHFQCAAWAFGEMKNQYSLVLKGDLSPELMIFMQQISFAQAQECILEKSLADNRKPAIIAKVTAQVISFYNAALSALFSQNEDGTIPDLVGNKLYKEWLKYIKFKTSYLSSVLFLHQGMNSEEQRKMGERVALYNAACEKLEEAKKESKGMSKIEVINEALVFATDIIEGKRKNAKQENEFIYHENIPEISSISAVQGANLVQGISFDVSDPQVIGEDVFKRLVPMKTHEHLSIYSEEKANILRRLGAAIDERDAELASFMGSLNTESLNAMKQSQQKLPQGLVDRCAELSAKPNAISDLVESMSNLADICCDVEITLKEIKRILDDEAKQEQNYQKQMGKRPTGPMAELNREYTKYLEGHNKAGESNDTLRKAMELHVSNLKILGQPLSVLKNQVPQADPIDENTMKELHILLTKVEEMKKQRDDLFNDLREQILNKDDITAQLIAHGDKDVEELFQKELKKYSHSVNIIEQNLVAQGNILKALTDTYAKHAMTLKSYNDAKLKRDQFYSSLIASFDVYEDLMSKSAKGLDFYKKLHGNVQKLMSRVKASRDVHEEERQQLLKNALPKVSPVDSTNKATDTSYKSLSSKGVPSSGGPKLKDYLKSGMVPGMGGLRDDLSKLPAVRPSPLGQENVSASNPASCQTMNYPSSNYRGHQAYQPEIAYPGQQQISYYPTSDQLSVNSGSGSLSSSSTSLNSDYYSQGANYGMTGNQGYVNPIYQTGTQSNYKDQSGGLNQVPLANNSYPNTYQQPEAMNPYGNYGSNYDQKQQMPQANQQYDYYKNENMSTQQPSVAPSPENFQPIQQQQNMSYNPAATNHSYSNPANKMQSSTEHTQGMYGNQYQVPTQYPVAQSPAQQTQQYQVSQGSTLQSHQYPVVQSPVQQPQQYPVAQSPITSQYSGGQQPQLSGTNPQIQAVVQPAQPNIDQQYSMTYNQNTAVNHQQPQQSFNTIQNQSFVQQDYANQPNYFNYNNSNVQTYMGNQYGEHLSQQNYACYTPTVNSINSYMTASDAQTSQSQTTQSTNYSQQPGILQSHVHMMNQPSVESPQHQPRSIPTYSAAVNATATNNSEMHMTQSQQQISSPIETNQKPPEPKPAEIKSKNIDLLSGIDFSSTNSSVDNIPTLTPVSVTLKKEESPKKILEPTPTPTTSAVKINEDLADLDFNSLTPLTRQESPNKSVEPIKRKKVEDPFDDGSTLKHFHKEVESMEKFMETLTVKTLNGVTPLANKWKELQDLLVKDEAQRSVSVARLFPDKNRSVDCLPYDHGRVLLPTATDNYINAVLVKDCGSVGFILTQTPMVNTVNDYWEMVWNQRSNNLVCLHSPNEVNL